MIYTSSFFIVNTSFTLHCWAKLGVFLDDLNNLAPILIITQTDDFIKDFIRYYKVGHFNTSLFPPPITSKQPHLYPKPNCIMSFIRACSIPGACTATHHNLHRCHQRIILVIHSFASLHGNPRYSSSFMIFMRFE